MQWESLRTILALGAILSMPIRQFDIKSAYLHGVIQEEVWVDHVKFVLERDFGVVRIFGVVGFSEVSEVVGCLDRLWLQL